MSMLYVYFIESKLIEVLSQINESMTIVTPLDILKFNDPSIINIVFKNITASKLRFI